MNNKQALVFTVTAMGAGFVAGLMLGRNTNNAMKEQVTADYKSGVVTITANIGNALVQGLNDTINDIFK